MKSKILLTLAAFGLSLYSAEAIPIEIDGIIFPQGERSFADAVVHDALDLGDEVGPPHNEPENALGVPNNQSVSLGASGVLVLEFVDNALTTSGDAMPDLHVFEIGPVVESFQVEISTDMSSWIDVGFVSGQPTSLDIDGVDGVVLGAMYHFVRLTDDGSTEQIRLSLSGADIDAVGAISTTRVPESTSSIVFIGLGISGLLFFRSVTNRE